METLPFFFAYLAGTSGGVHVLPVVAGGLALSWYVLRPGLGTPPRPGLCVKNAVFTLVFFDALAALGSGDLVVAAICAGLYPVILGLAAWLRQRGS